MLCIELPHMYFGTASTETKFNRSTEAAEAMAVLSYNSIWNMKSNVNLMKIEIQSFEIEIYC